MLMPLTTCAFRLHSYQSSPPDTMTQEVNRCLRLVRIAASRRDDALPTEPRVDYRRADDR